MPGRRRHNTNGGQRPRRSSHAIGGDRHRGNGLAYNPVLRSSHWDDAAICLGGNAFLGWSVPIGTYKNGALDAVITPTIAYAKGFGHFDAQGTFGVGLPVADTNIVGRNYVWNNAFQYRVFRKFWPEVELNSTFFQDEPNDGRKQNFATPGLVIGRLHVWKGWGSQSAAITRLQPHTFIPQITTPFFRFAFRSDALVKPRPSSPSLSAVIPAPENTEMRRPFSWTELN